MGKIRQVGRYELVARLGEGGMATVYRARDPRFDRDVAVKILEPKLARFPEVQERFKIEAVIQAKLSHPHIVTVLDFIAEGETLAIVMELVQAKSLEVWLEEAEGPLSVPWSVEVLVQILSAIGHAHRNGLVHRDLKPSNILVQELAGRPHAKVMDFGIAKILGAEKVRTATLAKLGTVAYMSPEHIESPKKVDQRSDIYALGLTLYEMLSGRLPFDADSEYRLMRQILEEEPAPLTDLAEASRFEPVIRLALAKRPEDRFQSCDEMRDRLLAVQTPPPKEEASPEHASAREPKPAGSRSWVMPALVVGITILASVAFGLGRLWVAAEKQTDLHALEKARLEQEVREARDEASRLEEGQRLADLERQRQAEEDRRRAAELELQRQAEDDRQKAAELELQRQAEEERRKAAELEGQRQAGAGFAEIMRQRQAEEERVRLAEGERQRPTGEKRQQPAEIERLVEPEEDRGAGEGQRRLNRVRGYLERGETMRALELADELLREGGLPPRTRNEAKVLADKSREELARRTLARKADGGYFLGIERLLVQPPRVQPGQSTQVTLVFTVLTPKPKGTVEISHSTALYYDHALVLNLGQAFLLSGRGGGTMEAIFPIRVPSDAPVGEYEVAVKLSIPGTAWSEAASTTLQAIP